MEKHEVQVKNSKDNALKIKVKNNYNNQEDESTNDEDDDLIKKFEKFLRKERTKEMSLKEAPRRKVTCFNVEKEDMSKMNVLQFKRRIKSRTRRIKYQRMHM